MNFDGIEKKTGVKKEEVVKLANSLKGANLQDEQTVRNLVQNVAKIANKRVPKSTEDKIVDMLVKQKKKPDPQTISNMLNNKK